MNKALWIDIISKYTYWLCWGSVHIGSLFNLLCWIGTHFDIHFASVHIEFIGAHIKYTIHFMYRSGVCVLNTFWRAVLALIRTPLCLSGYILFCELYIHFCPSKFIKFIAWSMWMYLLMEGFTFLQSVTVSALFHCDMWYAMWTWVLGLCGVIFLYLISIQVSAVSHWIRYCVSVCSLVSMCAVWIDYVPLPAFVCRSPVLNSLHRFVPRFSLIFIR